jgi:hypothetical protein
MFPEINLQFRFYTVYWKSHAKVHGKEFAYYYDFYDLGSRYFTSASRQRMKILGEFGHNIEIKQTVEEC